MTQPDKIEYFQGSSFSDLFAEDIAGEQYGFILNYPTTASWARYPNTEKYFIQDGSLEETKVAYDKIVQKEPWCNLAVLGDDIPGILLRAPRNLLLNYWRDCFGFHYEKTEVLQRTIWCDYLNQSDRFDKLISRFPFDHILPEKHAVDPDEHYRLLSKTTLAEMGVHYPQYQIYNVHDVRLEDVALPDQYPYLVKTSHGLSGEGTYIIKSDEDLRYCSREVRNYLASGLLDNLIVSEFVKGEVANYCVQFYVNKQGQPTLIGATTQMVTPQGEFAGGLIYYDDHGMDKFLHQVAVISRFLHKHGYFGVVGIDSLEDGDGQLHLIDANIRVNGSTPLCLQRNTMRALGKQVAKYSTDYRMDGTLDTVLTTLKKELDRKDFVILSAVEKAHYGNIFCEIYGIVTGETVQEMNRIEEGLAARGLQLSAG